MADRLIARIILALFSISILYWFRIYFEDIAIPSVDLPSYIQRSSQLREQLAYGRIAFYDPFTFLGYPVFHFYGFLTALITVAISFLCDLVTDNSMRMAAHLTLLIGVAALPWSFYYFARALAEEFAKISDWMLALSAGAASFWFINHDYQYFGVGAAAVMNIGLVAQLLGWHLLLVYLGALARSCRLETPSTNISLALLVAALIITHLMTAAFAFFIGGCAFLWFERARLAWIKAHLMGGCLAAFWLIPFISYVGEYTAFDPAAPEGDPIRIFFRYPIAQVLTLIPRWIQGQGQLISISEFVFIASIVTIVITPKLRSSKIAAFLLFNAVGMILLTSSFVLSSLTLPFHYYRFNGYLVLMLAASLTPIPAIWSAALKTKSWSILPIKAMPAAILILSLVINWALPHYERQMIQELSHSADYLRDENRVLDYFAGLPQKGRVYFESLRDYKRYTPLSANYMNSNLYKHSGFESAVNSHVQEALGYRMLAVSAKLLKARTYNVPLLFSDKSELSDQTKIDQLRQFGITHVVGDTPEFIERLAEYSPMPLKKFGKYQVVQIGEIPLEKVTPVTKRLVGYMDLTGNLPFRFLEYYFYAREKLYSEFDLVELDPKLPIPKAVHTLIINAKSKELLGSDLSKELNEREHLKLRYQRHHRLDHYKVNYSNNSELDAYSSVENYLDKTFDLTGSLFNLKTPLPPKVQSRALMSWDPDYQSFTVSNLTPGEIYRINYSYLPYWQSRQGRIFRGSMERIFFEAREPEARVEYNRMSSIPWQIGVGISCLTLLLVICGRLFVRR